MRIKGELDTAEGEGEAGTATSGGVTSMNLLSIDVQYSYPTFCPSATTVCQK